MTLPTNELLFLIDSLSLHDSKGELCVESQEDDQTYLMSVPACSIPDTADVVKALATQRIADAKRIAELEAALTEARRAIGSHAAPDARLVPVEQLDRWMGYTSQHGGAANCLKEIRAIIMGQP